MKSGISPGHEVCSGPALSAVRDTGRLCSYCFMQENKLSPLLFLHRNTFALGRVITEQVRQRGCHCRSLQGPWEVGVTQGRKFGGGWWGVVAVHNRVSSYTLSGVV